MERRWNAGVGETGVPRENPPASGIVQHDSHIRKSGSEPAGDRTRIALVGGECASRLSLSGKAGDERQKKDGVGGGIRSEFSTNVCEQKEPRPCTAGSDHAHLPRRVIKELPRRMISNCFTNLQNQDVLADFEQTPRVTNCHVADRTSVRWQWIWLAASPRVATSVSEISKVLPRNRVNECRYSTHTTLSLTYSMKSRNSIKTILAHDTHIHIAIEHGMSYEEETFRMMEKKVIQRLRFSRPYLDPAPSRHSHFVATQTPATKNTLRHRLSSLRGPRATAKQSKQFCRRMLATLCSQPSKRKGKQRKPAEFASSAIKKTAEKTTLAELAINTNILPRSSTQEETKKGCEEIIPGGMLSKIYCTQAVCYLLPVMPDNSGCCTGRIFEAMATGYASFTTDRHTWNHLRPCTLLKMASMVEDLPSVKDSIDDSKVYKSFHCNKCDDVFIHSDNLYRHKKNCKGNVRRSSRSKCKYCSKTFPASSSIRQHEAIDISVYYEQTAVPSVLNTVRSVLNAVPSALSAVPAGLIVVVWMGGMAELSFSMVLGDVLVGRADGRDVGVSAGLNSIVSENLSYGGWNIGCQGVCLRVNISNQVPVRKLSLTVAVMKLCREEEKYIAKGSGWTLASIDYLGMSHSGASDHLSSRALVLEVVNTRPLFPARCLQTSQHASHDTTGASDLRRSVGACPKDKTVKEDERIKMGGLRENYGMIDKRKRDGMTAKRKRDGMTEKRKMDGNDRQEKNKWNERETERKME
ncbi:hypothetical protein PR048_020294 [Dryococelus australis]|uniref:C2H2-type domain-containing protein n=1 Tax=Dryococelus australis TaxID=614101 RepID=A0ABQ9H5X2_9NEOP|nr:hypothetical protein PR048_020294 [Dryococelus australis]